MRSLSSLFLCFALLTNFQPAYADANKSAKKNEEKGLMLSSAVLIASAIAGFHYITNCNSQPSAMVFTFSSAMFVFNEIKNWNNYKKASDREMKINNKEEYDKQLTSIQAAAKQTREAAEAAKTRANSAKSASTGFALSAVIALIEGVLHSIPTINYDDTCSGSSSGFNPIQELFIAQAHAGDSMGVARTMGIIGGASLFAIPPLIQSQSTLLSAGNSSGYARAAIMAGFSLATKLAADEIDKAAKKFNERATEYDNLLKRLLARLNRQQFDTTPLPPEKIPSNEARGMTSGCAKGNTLVEMMNDPQCSCRATHTCKTIKAIKPNYKSFEFPPVLSQSIDLLKDSANASFNGNDSKASSLGSQLQGKSAAIRGARKSVEDLAKKRNLAIPDLDQEAQKSMANMRSEMNQLFKRMGPQEQKDFFAKTGGGLVDFGLNPQEGDLKSIQKALLQSPAEESNANRKNAAILDEGSKFQFMFESRGEVTALDASEELAKFSPVKDQDINTEKDVSLFEIISMRYLKSAFPKLFEKKEN